MSLHGILSSAVYQQIAKEELQLALQAWAYQVGYGDEIVHCGVSLVRISGVGETAPRGLIVFSTHSRAATAGVCLGAGR